MIYTCTRRFQFCAGHRVHMHESKCRNLHGHNYVAHVTVAKGAEGSELDDLGRVVDFSALKEIIGAWIDAHWDHKFVLYANDTEARAAVALTATPIYVMQSNPTAENMARELFDVADRLLVPKGIYPVRVVLEETENCRAEYAL